MLNAKYPLIANDGIAARSLLKPNVGNEIFTYLEYEEKIKLSWLCKSYKTTSLTHVIKAVHV